MLAETYSRPRAAGKGYSTVELLCSDRIMDEFVATGQTAGDGEVACDGLKTEGVQGHPAILRLSRPQGYAAAPIIFVAQEFLHCVAVNAAIVLSRQLSHACGTLW